MRIAVFFALKIFEACVVVVVPYAIGANMDAFAFPCGYDHPFMIWFFGIFWIFVCFVMFIALGGLWALAQKIIDLNMKWSKHICEMFKR